MTAEHVEVRVTGREDAARAVVLFLAEHGGRRIFTSGTGRGPYPRGADQVALYGHLQVNLAATVDAAPPVAPDLVRACAEAVRAAEIRIGTRARPWTDADLARELRRTADEAVAAARDIFDAYRRDELDRLRAEVEQLRGEAPASPSPGRTGMCPEPGCGRRIGLNQHGRMATHYKGTQGRPIRCPGTGQQPAEEGPDA